MSYSTQQAWRDIQSFLPPAYQLGKDDGPEEERWSWRGHAVHVDRFSRPDAAAKVILFHGVGTNGRQLTMILGAPLARSGFETIAIDMPGYGMTELAPGPFPTYDEWVELASDFIDAELARDDRPIVLYGLSAGGMLTYHAAALNKKVKGIVGMTFLDQRERVVSDTTSISVWMNRIGVPFTHQIVKTPLAALRIPIRLVAKMGTLVNDEAALKAFLRDRTSAGAWVSLEFLSSYLRYVPAVEPEDFDVCPILLTQPAADRWSPLHLSEIFLARVTRVSKRVVMLPNAGHYPIEEPGLTRMHDAIVDFVKASCAR